LGRDENGYPLIEDCLKKSFAEYYFTYDVGMNSKRLFTNADGIADAFA